MKFDKIEIQNNMQTIELVGIQIEICYDLYIFKRISPHS